MTSALMISIILSMAMVEGLLGTAKAMEVEASDCDGFRAAACPLTESNILNFDNKQVSFYFVPRTRRQAGFNRLAFVGWLYSTPQNSISVPQKYLQLQKTKQDLASCQRQCQQNILCHWFTRFLSQPCLKLVLSHM